MGWYELRNAHCRIYRPIRPVDHALQMRSADWTETTGVDVPGRLMEEGGNVIELGASYGEVTGTLLVPRGTDIHRGYVVAITKLRTALGVRAPATTTLADGTATGATTLSVSSIVGFESGDFCILERTGGGACAFVLKAVVPAVELPPIYAQMELYSDQKLPFAGSAGDAVTVKSLWLVEQNVRPQSQRGPYSVRVRQLPGTFLYDAPEGTSPGMGEM